MLDTIISILWIMLPAGVSNMSPVLFKWTNFLNKPVDLGKKYNNKFLFGKNKTYRGFFFGTITGMIAFYLQVLLYPYVSEYTFFDYTEVNILIIGFLFGFGALLGDLVESFFKRRLGIKSGESWPVFDQIDWILGSLILTYPVLKLDWNIYFYIILIWGILHPVINLIGYWIGIKKNKF